MRFSDPAAARAREPRALPAGSIFDIWSLRSGGRFAHEAAIRSLCQTAYLGDHRALCRVLGRYKFYVDTRDIGLASHLMLDGFWEMWNTEALLTEVHPGMTAIDVGAHCGYFSAVLADIVGPQGRVLSFEPNPRMAELLGQTMAVNGFDDRFALQRVALGAAAGLAGLVVPDGEPKNAHIVPLASRADAQTIELRRLDSYPEALAADFIKIDAEGAEEQIWRGMRGILDNGRPLKILLEFTPGRYADAGAFLDEILSSGFTLRLIDLADGILPIAREAVLSAPATEDQMLLLTRD